MWMRFSMQTNMPGNFLIAAVMYMCSVGIVRSRTKATEFSFLVFYVQGYS